MKYGYHFIIKELECLGDNTGKYITFLVPINKKLENNKAITYKTKFIDIIRFISSSSLSLVDNLSERLRINKCKALSSIYINEG